MSHGVVTEGQTVGAGGAAHHLWATTAQRKEDEGNQEDLQV